MTLRTDHVVVRFLATLVANIVRTGLSFVTGVLVARSLGAADYGNLSFLLGSFAAINLVLDMGSSPAFYTLISQRKRGARFYALYLLWTVGVQFFGTIVVIALLMPRNVVHQIWLGHDRSIVLLAFGATFLTSQIWTMVSQIGEALRKTVVVQGAAVAQALMHLVLIVAAMQARVLSIPVVFWLLIAEYLLLISILGPILYRRSVTTGVAESGGEVLRQFVVYCRPLVLYGIIGFVHQFADRWLLQRFGGAREQGFFSVGQQFANLSLLATTSVLHVLWKEMAEARERGEIGSANAFFGSIRHTLYFFAAWVSCMAIPYAADILAWTVGSDYRGAHLPTALMLLYPVHQTLGQIQGMYLLSTGNTGAHARIGILMMVIGLPATYLALAPSGSFPGGLGLGATGLVVKMLVVQQVGVALQVRALVRTGSISYDFGYQFALLGILLLASFGCRWIVDAVLGIVPHISRVVSVWAGCLLYAVVTAGVVLRHPRLAGIDREILARGLGSLQDSPAR